MRYTQIIREAAIQFKFEEKCFEVLNCIHFSSTFVGSIFSALKLPYSYA